MIKSRPLQSVPPPSSRGPGRDPFKVKTGVRIPVGAPSEIHLEPHQLGVEQFLNLLRFKQHKKRSCPSPSGEFGMFLLKPTNSLQVLNNYISVQVAAQYSGYSSQYLRRLLRNGKLGGIKIGQLLLAMMVQTYDVTESPKQSDEGKMTITMRPKYGLPVIITTRNS
jgi:hypothetical protein